MPQSTAERVTAQFYAWEQRGRGWLWCDMPVEPEPPFHPFLFHRAPAVSHKDDGYKSTLLSFLPDLFRGRKNAKSEQPETTFEEADIDPIFFESSDRISVLSLSLPKGQKVRVEETEQLLLMLSNCQNPLAFEIIGSSSNIRLQFACREPEKGRVASLVKAYFPECIVKEATDLLDEISLSASYASVMEYGLRDEFMRPVAMAKSFDLDPFTGIFAAFDHLLESEFAVIQILFAGAVNPWAESIMRSVTDSDGKAFFQDAPDMVPLAKEKISFPLFGVTMKIMGAGPTPEKAQEVGHDVGKSFVRIYTAPSNALIPLSADLPFQDMVDDMLLRQTHRMGMLLNARELATIVHLPSASITSSRLERDARKTKKAPLIADGHSFVIGVNEHQGLRKNASVSDSQRLKHTHIIGATGTGKSTLLESMIVQDIAGGKGLAVLDPHGDLIETILAHIPPERTRDVIVIDPADAEYPVGFNILTAHSEVEKDILSSDLVAVFKRLSTSWGDQMNSVFANAILAFLESSDGGTLVELRRFLVEKSFRDKFLASVGDPSITYYWQKEFPLLKSGSIGPILTRLDTFLRPKLIRNMVAQKKSLDFEHILDSGKILLVKLSQGLIGAENSFLLGTFFVSKMYQAATARQAKSKESRSDFFLYIDEFQNFITPSMSAILSGARKYHLAMTLVHQEMQQLLKYDTELASSVVANAGTRICFRLGDADAKRFAGGFSSFEAADLENLNTGEAIARIERPDYDFTLTTIPLTVPEEATAEARQSAIIEQSRKSYSTPRGEVEQQFESLRDAVAEVLPKNAAPAAPRPSAELPVKELQAERKPAEKGTPVEISAPDIVESLTKKKAETQHRYLQTLIKKMAESRGYKATIEAMTPDGKGKVDVSLERNGKKIACEICVTTETAWELHNVEKCLAAGYDAVISISTEKRTLENIKGLVEKSFDQTTRSKLFQFEPEELFLFLDTEVAKDATSETRMKGYRVKVEYGAVSADEMSKKKSTVGKAVLESKKKK